MLNSKKILANYWTTFLFSWISLYVPMFSLYIRYINNLCIHKVQILKQFFVTLRCTPFFSFIIMHHYFFMTSSTFSNKLWITGWPTHTYSKFVTIFVECQFTVTQKLRCHSDLILLLFYFSAQLFYLQNLVFTS